ncbi:MAG: response regulator [Planctomycetota bacterium]|jgi:DNA-binding NarL/FixJ family response regulator
MSIRILLADDHKIVRDGLRSLLEKEPDMEVAAEADNGRMAVELAGELRPDVVVMDVAMPDLNGMEATRQIVRSVPGARVVALSMHSDKRFVRGMLASGASGYVLKDAAFEELIRAIRSVVAGRTYLCPEVTGVVVESLVQPSGEAEPSSLSVLTPREREVLQLLAEGKRTKQIATLLKVSVKTIETHRGRIMGKLDCYSVAELTKYAIREGLTTLDG